MLKLIRVFKEGLRIFKCGCGHIVNIAKGKEASCLYCGCKETKEIPLPII